MKLVAFIKKNKLKTFFGVVILSYLLLCQSCATMRMTPKEDKVFFDTAKLKYKDSSIAIDDSKIHYIETGKKENPTWYLIDLVFVKKFKRFLALDEIKKIKDLKGMLLTQKGSRLSVQPVSEKHWETILGSV